MAADPHSIKASKLFKVPLEEVTLEMRMKAKAVNFALTYGVTKVNGNPLEENDGSYQLRP